RCLIMALAFQVAEDERRLIPGGQSLQFAVDSGHEFALAQRGSEVQGHGRLLLSKSRILAYHGARDLAAACRTVARLPGQAPGDAVEPSSDRLRLANSDCFLSENQEYRLKDILCTVMIAENPAGDAQHHRSMALEQLGQGRLVALAGEPAHKLGVAGSISIVD